jgi:1-acyl-sn-glycerol-3-phosphate acyltransferase
MRTLTPVGRLLQRFGAIRASPENARRVLRSGGALLVYPGGELDAFRHTKKRDAIVFGPRDGYVRVAQETGAPIVPIVVHGAHRSAYILSEGEQIVRLLRLERLRMERFPVALSLPWVVAFGPMPYLPLPFRVTMEVLAPITVAHSDDPRERSREIALTMQRALDRMAD